MATDRDNAYEYWNRIDSSNKMSLKDLCEASGVSYVKVRQNRTDMRLMGCMETLALSKALNVSMEYLLEGSTDNKFQEYFAYLEKADKWQIAAVRRILEMPDLK